MKRRLLALATTALATVTGLPSAALAADKPAAKSAKQAEAKPAEGDESAEGEAAEGESSEAAESEAAAPAVRPSEIKGQQVAPAQPAADYGTFKNGVPKPPPDNVAMPNVNETHTVTKGDTLWDLSQHYLGNPWYWPKVWSYNPQIANPHWIYPGDKVKFSGQGGASSDEEAPAQVQPQAPTAENEEGDDDTGTEEEAPPVTSTRKIGYVAPKTSSFRQDGFVTDRELEESGQIFKSEAEKEMLDNLDGIYCRFKSQGDAKVGDRFFIFKTVREVTHPITGKHYGYMTHIVGTATVKSLDANNIVTAVIDHTFDEIHRGDYLAPYSDKLSRQVAQKPASNSVHGVVLDSLRDLSMLGESMVVFVDKGKRDGIEDGNVLEVTRQADGLAGQLKQPGEAGFEDTRLPITLMGRLMVIDAKENTSTCLVLQSIREFIPGDKWNTVTTTAGSVSLR